MANNEEIDFDIGFPAIFWSLMMNVNTAMPGEVISFNNAKETIQVQPSLKRLYERNDEATPLPVMDDVKVVFPGSDDFCMTFPLKPGASVLLIISQRAIDVWQKSGGIVDPNAKRKFSIRDAIAISGINPDSRVLDPPVELDGISLRTRDNSVYAKVMANQFKVKNGDDSELTVTTEGTTIKGNLTVEGAIEGESVAVPGVDLATHTHSGVTVGSGVTGAPVPVP